MMLDQRGTLTISSENFLHNLNYFQSLIPAGSQLSAVVKANAYGHGLEHILQLLTRYGVQWCSVFSLVEAAAVLETAPMMHVHVLCPVSFSGSTAPDSRPSPSPDLLARAATQQVHLTLQDIPNAELLNSAGRTLGRRILVQIQIDVGLTRQGCTPDEFPSLLKAIRDMDHLQLTAVFAHFSHGEAPDNPISQNQYETFLHLARPLRKNGVLTHIHNSGGAVRNIPIDVDLVRIGIGLYGLQPSLDYPIQELQPIAELTAPVVTVHNRPAGTGVGYGHQFVTRRDTQIAILPVGYADGYRRELGGSAIAIINQQRYPIVGRISMDQMAVDVTEGKVQVGDSATVISSDAQSDISMDHLAQQCRTIGYELATGLGHRIARILR